MASHRSNTAWIGVGAATWLTLPTAGNPVQAAYPAFAAAAAAPVAMPAQRKRRAATATRASVDRGTA